MVENIQNIQKLLSKYNLKLWILINKDNNDNIFYKYISKTIYTLSMCFITVNKTYLLIHDLDKYNIDNKYLEKNNIIVIFYNTLSDLSNRIEDIISYLGFISQVSLSYSTMGDKDTDILGHGQFVEFSNIIKKPYIKYKKTIKFNSAEKVIYSLLSEKTENQIERIKFVANITQEILETTFKTITIGMSEIDISKHIIGITENITNQYLDKKIISVSLAWENCPIVLIGINLSKGGHTIPSEKALKKGNTIYFDFGICATYEDGEKIYSDIQRMGYALKRNETRAPRSVQKVFKSLTESIENALDHMKPDVKGYEIDDIVRNRILRDGYPNYNHSTGHPVGLKVHDVGAILSNKSNKKSNLGLIENGVYTIEPRIAIPNGGSIEEMFIVTKFGGIPVCKMQKEIYLV
ncbi:MAG: M24 family metallopeptidase [Clostridia bacterium]|nr:M24 family metallopeptidase [Clostridia bacterium]MDD4386847.1 M24 family metallopeptidase [Clostridia bacterium]